LAHSIFELDTPAVGPDGIPIEAWKHLGELAVKFLTTQFNNILKNEEIPEEWRKSVLVPIYKNKGETQECGNYRGIKLMIHTMKMWELLTVDFVNKCRSVSSSMVSCPGKAPMMQYLH